MLRNHNRRKWEEFVTSLIYILPFLLVHTHTHAHTHVHTPTHMHTHTCAHTHTHTDKEMEDRALSSLGAAQKKIKLEIQDLSDRLKVSREAIQRLKEQIDKAEEEKG